MKKVLAILLLLPAVSFSKGMQCGPFHLESANDGFMHINGQKPETQKMTFLKQKDDFDNVMMQWMLPDANVGRWLGIDYVKRNKKAILNVEVVRTNMSQPREFWTYDCERVK
ncbi:hypothetical protein GKQ23_13590 [Erwinia sp. E602]|uniref:hypothetical protein n=1 Tax=Erwinia sp. E602 TaxID=2675378 RepID=UPI001BA83A8F|nr:hypothetical protein [Erwinia sp. E602]QUG75964.1 hypothetical protein GKQ23_13590 [Erwinia sp. E602]